MAEIEFALKKKGENASNPHCFPTDRPIQKGDVFLFDLGVKNKGYSSDITRTVVFDITTIFCYDNIILNPHTKSSMNIYTRFNRYDHTWFQNIHVGFGQ